MRYVVIGGLAAVMHGSSAATGDVDICPERSTANLEHLAAALREISTLAFARPRSPRDRLRGRRRVPRAMAMVNLVTDFGDLDISYQPAGFAGYEELVDHAVEIDVVGRRGAGGLARRRHPLEGDRRSPQGPRDAPDTAGTPGRDRGPRARRELAGVTRSASSAISWRRKPATVTSTTRSCPKRSTGVATWAASLIDRCCA